MKTFKTFLKEYLTDEQRERYSQYTLTPEAKALTDHYFKGNDKVEGRIEGDDKSEIHTKLENHLGRSLSHEEYKSGVVKDKYGRDVKLGRLIKDQSLRNDFDRDTTRKFNQSGFKTSTVRGIEVAGQTNSTPNEQHPKGHSWHTDSCKNIVTGSNKHYLPYEIKHGTVVHFVHDHNGQEVYRATLQPHFTDDGVGHMYAVDAEYGLKHPKFTESSRQLAHQLSSKSHSPGQLYTIHDDVYNDSGVAYKLHPNESYSDLLKHVKSPDYIHAIAAVSHVKADKNIIDHAIQHPDYQVVSSSLKSPNVDSSHVAKLAVHIDRDVRAEAVKHPKATSAILDHALKDPSPWVRMNVFKNPKATAAHIAKGIEDEDSDVVERAAAHPNISDADLHKAVNHYSSHVRIEALNNPAVKPKHIDKWLSHHSSNIREWAAEHPKASSENITTALKSPFPEVVQSAANRSDLKPEHLDFMMKHEDSYIAKQAAGHKNISPEQIDYILQHRPEHVVRAAVFRKTYSKIQPHHISKALDDESVEVRRTAITHPKATPEHISKALDDKDESVRSYAIHDQSNASRDNIDKALKDPSPRVRVGAVIHPNTTYDQLHSMLNDPSDDVRWNAERRVRRHQPSNH